MEKLNKYLTVKNLVLAAAGILVLVLLGVIFCNRKPDPLEGKLQEQQRQIDQLTKTIAAKNEADRVRDSALQAGLAKHDQERGKTITIIQKSANDKIDHINSAAFTADSLRRAFAEQ